MARSIALVGAPSSIGLRPYDDGLVRHVNRAPSVLRERGLAARLRAADLGDVAPPPYADFSRRQGRARNEPQLVSYLRALGARVAAALAGGQFAVVLGGDCSIVLACLLAARRRAGAVGLAYLDAHGDYATPEDSPSGSASSMALSLAVGRGATPLASLGGETPLVDPHHVAVIGRRDRVQSGCGTPLADSPILDIPASQLDAASDLADVGFSALVRIAPREVRGFWIHIDADVLNPSTMGAVDSPEPGGPAPDDLLKLLAPLVTDPRALGVSLSIYDPALDPDRSCARQLVNMLAALLAPPPAH